MIDTTFKLHAEVPAPSGEPALLKDRKPATRRAYVFQKADRQADAARIFRAIEEASVHAAPSRFGPPAFHFSPNGRAASTDQRLRSHGHR